MLTPALLGVLGKQFSGQGFDPASLSRLLASQKNNIAAAMPSGFKDLLQSPEFSRLSLAEPSGQRAAPSATWPAAASASSSAWESPLRWIVPLVVLGALIWGLSSFYNNRTSNVTQQAAAPGAQTEVIVAAGGVVLKSATQRALDGVTTTLRQVSDEATAKAALPKLQSAASELDNVIQLSSQLPAEGKKTIGSLVAAAQPATTQLFNKVQGIPAANNVAKPTIDALKEKIDTLSKAA
jgi:hypothetical protein